MEITDGAWDIDCEASTHPCSPEVETLSLLEGCSDTEGPDEVEVKDADILSTSDNGACEDRLGEGMLVVLDARFCRSLMRLSTSIWSRICSDNVGNSVNTLNEISSCVCSKRESSLFRLVHGSYYD